MSSSFSLSWWARRQSLLRERGRPTSVEGEENLRITKLIHLKTIYRFRFLNPFLMSKFTRGCIKPVFLFLNHPSANLSSRSKIRVVTYQAKDLQGSEASRFVVRHSPYCLLHHLEIHCQRFHRQSVDHHRFAR